MLEIVCTCTIKISVLINIKESGEDLTQSRRHAKDIPERPSSKTYPVALSSEVAPLEEYWTMLCTPTVDGLVMEPLVL
jgi:hypothetical protein